MKNQKHLFQKQSTGMSIISVDYNQINFHWIVDWFSLEAVMDAFTQSHTNVLIMQESTCIPLASTKAYQEFNVIIC